LEAFFADLHLEAKRTRGRNSARALRSSRDEQLSPPLHSPELVAIAEGAFTVRGFESTHGTGYVQEWRCVIE
jgi:hypothetical protein